MEHTLTSGGVVLNSQGYVLVVNQHGLAWSLPKGHVEPGEDLRTTAAREIAEESGITKLEFIKELGTYQRYRLNKVGGDDKRNLKTITIFLYKTLELKLEPQDPTNPEARWVSADQVADLLTHYKDKEFFTSILPKIQVYIA